MAVLTQKEYLKIKKTDKSIGSDDEQKPLSDPKLEEPKITYFLFYPDNPSSKYYNGDFLVKWDGETHKLEIVNGVISTTNEAIKNILIAKGFSFMYEKKAEGQ